MNTTFPVGACINSRDVTTRRNQQRAFRSGIEDAYLHAGDVGHPAVLGSLAEIAPLRAVRGNVDLDPWARALPLEEEVELPGGIIFMTHIIGSPESPTRCVRKALLRRQPRLILFGHTHDPLHEIRDGIHFLNPGSAGPPNPTTKQKMPSAAPIGYQLLCGT